MDYLVVCVFDGIGNKSCRILIHDHKTLTVASDLSQHIGEEIRHYLLGI